VQLSEKVEKLEARKQELESQKDKDSHNSHKPPSSDGLKRVINQLIPNERLCEALKDLYGCAISEGTLHNWSLALHEKLEGVEQSIKDLIRTSDVIHAVKRAFIAKRSSIGCMLHQHRH
jgi:Transposase IS66 family/Family of unknown function (DUF6444)